MKNQDGKIRKERQTILATVKNKNLKANQKNCLLFHQADPRLVFFSLDFRFFLKEPFADL